MFFHVLSIVSSFLLFHSRLSFFSFLFPTFIDLVPHVEESNSIIKSESNSQISAASSPGYSPSKMTRSSTRNATKSDKNSTRKNPNRKKCFDPYSNAGDSTEDDTNEAHYATRTRRAGRNRNFFKSSDSMEKTRSSEKIRSSEKSSRAKRSCRLNKVKNEDLSDDEMEEDTGWFLNLKMLDLGAEIWNLNK